MSNRDILLSQFAVHPIDHVFLYEHFYPACPQRLLQKYPVAYM